MLETTSGEYYGKGYQDVQNRVPKIANTMADLDWAPKVNMRGCAAQHIFEAYRGDVAEARKLDGLRCRRTARCPKLALKIDVDTYRGTREGVPRLVEMLRRTSAGATFLFSLGPDHTGRAIKRAFRPGFMKKVSRTSVRRALRPEDPDVRHPAARPRHRPALRRHPARRARRRLRSRHPLLGPRQMAGRRRAAPTPPGPASEMQRACDRFAEIFGETRQGPRRRRLADERPRAAPDAAPGLRLLLRHARHATPSCRCGTARSSPARNCRPPCRRWTN